MGILQDRPTAQKRREEKRVSPSWMLSQIATGIKEEQGVYEEYPVDAEEFYLGREFMALERWSKPLFPPAKGGKIFNKVLDTLIAIDQPNVRQAVLLWGKGSGKSFAVACIMARQAYIDLGYRSPQSFYGLAPGDPIFYINTSTAGRQAQDVVFGSTVNRLKHSEWFRQVEHSFKGLDLGEFLPFGGEIRFNKNLFVLSGNSRSISWLGYAVRVGILDELAYFTDVNDKPNAEACWDTFYDSCFTRFPNHYKLIGITSPRSVDGFEMQKFEELRKEKDSAFVSQKATWEINEKVSKDDFKSEFKKNPIKARRNFAAIPTRSVNSVWGTEEQVESLDEYFRKDLSYNFSITKKQLDPNFRPQRGTIYCAHGDLGSIKDPCAFAVSHLEGWKSVTGKKRKDDEEEEDWEEPIIQTDIIAWWKPEPNKNVKLRVVRELIYQLSGLGMQFGVITFDQALSLDTRQQLEERGYDVDLLSVDRGLTVFEEVQACILDNRALIPYHPVLVKEAKGLEDKGGKKVDHPKRFEDGSKGTKDVWDAVSGSIYDVITESGSDIGFA